MAITPFLSGLLDVQGRTRQHSVEGSGREDSAAHRDTVILLLNDILASEVIWLLRYRRRFLLGNGLATAADPSQGEELGAARLARRIVALGGEPVLDLDNLLARSRADYASSGSVEDRLREDLRAEAMVIASYVEVIGYLGAADPQTREVLKTNLAHEQLRAAQLAQLLRELHEQNGEEARSPLRRH